jgi:hypothetical protein
MTRSSRTTLVLVAGGLLTAAAFPARGVAAPWEELPGNVQGQVAMCAGAGGVKIAG